MSNNFSRDNFREEKGLDNFLIKIFGTPSGPEDLKLDNFLIDFIRNVLIAEVSVCCDIESNQEARPVSYTHLTLPTIYSV